MAFDRARSTAPPPKRARESRGVAPLRGSSLPLRLTVARGALGIELTEVQPVGPIEVSRLSMTLPGLSFPLDLSGGVAQFRHRRGELQLLELTATTASLAAFLEPAANDVMGVLLRPITVWQCPGGVGIGLVSDEGALAFDWLWAPDADSARVVVANARGAGLAAPALSYVLRVLDTALAQWVKRRGRLVTFERAAARVLAWLMPSLGARVPACDPVRLQELRAEAGQLLVVFDASQRVSNLPVHTVRALESATLAEQGDELLLEGQLDAARTAYLEKMELAPRHPDLARAVAEVDVCAGGRSQSALGLLVESLPAVQAGLVGAELLANVGDLVAAREAVSAAAASEPYAPLAALGWLKLSEYEPAALDRLAALDRGCARAPTLNQLRWHRLEVRLERRDFEGALADAQHLEASTRGAAARHETCRRAARLFLEAGQKQHAGKLFERALRYLPDDPVATAGLARAFMEANKPLRAVALLERAVSLADKQGLKDAAALIDLAKVLARQLKDLPAAVSRLGQVPASSERIVEAYALEGRFRASLGDLSGATLAYAHMREACELAASEEPRAKSWLLEAARFEQEYQHDVFAAERHLALALKLAPRDEHIQERYRKAARIVAERRGRPRDADGGDT